MTEKAYRTTAILPPEDVRYARADGDDATWPLYMIDAGYFGEIRGARGSANDSSCPDAVILLYCTAGKATYIIDGNRIPLVPGRLIIHRGNDGSAYEIADDDSWSVYRIRFGGDIALKISGITGATPAFTADIDGDDIPMRIEEILSELEHDNSSDTLMYCSALLHYVIASSRRGKTRGDATPCVDSDIVGMAVAYMKEDLARRLTINDLTHLTGYSKPHFMLTFKRATGHSPMSYFNMLKIKKACSLLDTTDLKINQVCYAIGISDTFYFSRLFKKYMHLSPTAYRQRLHHKMQPDYGKETPDIHN